MKELKFTLKNKCGDCKFFEKCFNESSLLIYESSNEDKESSKSILACGEYEQKKPKKKMPKSFWITMGIIYGLLIAMFIVAVL